MARALILTATCDHCDAEEERVFTDSWTGKALCLMCLAPIANQIVMSPQSDDIDNLDQLLADSGR